MLFEEQIITITITPWQSAQCVWHAKKAEIGGKSNIRNVKERDERLYIDQLVGQLGECALSLYLTGDTTAYERQREVANNYPQNGDKGQDIIGLNLDIKTSAMRYDMDILEYNLAVRPQERHDNWCYILGLVEPNSTMANDVSLTVKRDIKVNLVGWLSDGELPDVIEQYGPFKGAYVARANWMHPLPNLKWMWR